MAVSRKNAADYIRCGKPFKGSNFRGEEGRPWQTGHLPRVWAETLRYDDPIYTVFSYATPIAWMNANGQWRFPDVKYSITTSGHQRAVSHALGYLAQSRTGANGTVCKQCEARYTAVPADEICIPCANSNAEEKAAHRAAVVQRREDRKQMRRILKPVTEMEEYLARVSVAYNLALIPSVRDRVHARHNKQGA